MDRGTGCGLRTPGGVSAESPVRERAVVQSCNGFNELTGVLHSTSKRLGFWHTIDRPCQGGARGVGAATVPSG